MNKKMTLYELFQTGLLKDAELLEIGKLKNLTKIIQVEKQREIQVFFSGMFTRSYHYKNRKLMRDL